MGWFKHPDGRETRYDPSERDTYVEDMKKRAREHEEQKKREREEKDRRKNQR